MTWDRISKGASCIISEDGLSVSSLNHLNSVRATEGVSDGKWYWEIRVNTAGAPLIGIIGSNASLLSSSLSNIDVRYYYTNGQKWNPKSEYGAPYTTGDLISVLLDLDLGTIEFMKNGVSQGVAFRDLKSMGEVFPAISDGGSAIGGSYTANFGDSNFTYRLPDGYSPYGKTKRMTIKNPTTDKLYSLSDNTLIHLPDNTTESIIEYGLEQGKFIQLDVPFDKHRHFNNTPVDGTSGKVFTQDVGVINTLSIKELLENKGFKPLYTWYNTKMTANNAPSPFVAFASSEQSATFSAWKAFDGNVMPIDNQSSWSASIANRNGTLALNFGSKKVFDCIRLTALEYTTSPKDFQIQATNDNTGTWTTLLNVTNEVWSQSISNETKVYTFDNTTEYQYYMIVITQVSAPNKQPMVTELVYGNVNREVN